MSGSRTLAPRLVASAQRSRIGHRRPRQPAVRRHRRAGPCHRPGRSAGSRPAAVRQALCGLRADVRRVRQRRHREPTFGQADRAGTSSRKGWPERTAAYLEGARRCSSRPPRKALDRRRPDRRRGRHRRHRLLHRHRHAQPGGAGARRRWAFARDVRARAGVRARLRRRRLRPVDRRPAGRSARPGLDGAARHGRAVHPRLPARQADQGQHRRHRAVRRRRRRLRAARRRQRRLARSRAAGEHTWPDTLDIMGWNVDPEGFGVIFARAIPPFARGQLSARAVDEHPGRPRPRPAPTSTASSATPAAPRSSTALEGALDLPQGALDHRARGAAPTTATCRRRPCCSCSSACCAAGLRDRAARSPRSAPASPPAAVLAARTRGVIGSIRRPARLRHRCSGWASWCWPGATPPRLLAEGAHRGRRRATIR